MINDILLSRLGTHGSFGLEKRKEKNLSYTVIVGLIKKCLYLWKI